MKKHIKHEELISIVIPVFNAEKYIEDCISSIRRQTYENLEIIIVDDGSTDESGIICDRLTGQDERIKVFHQGNRGVVSARQAGIEAASGEYIGFVDADDWIEPDMYEYMITHVGAADLISAGVFWEEEKDRIIRKRDAFAPVMYMGEEQLKKIYQKMLYDAEAGESERFTPWLWNKLFRRKKLLPAHSLVSVDLSLAEDAVCVYAYLLSCGSVVISDRFYYHYRYVEDSAVHRKDIGRLGRIERTYQCFYDIFVNTPGQYGLLYQLERWLQERCYFAINETMGLSSGIRFFRFLTDISEYKDKKVVLYGAGRAGRDIYTELRSFNCHVVLWVDREYAKFEGTELAVYPVSDILATEYDLILVAVESEKVKKEIKSDLTDMGIDADRVICPEIVKLF